MTGMWRTGPGSFYLAVIWEDHNEHYGSANGPGREGLDR